MFSKIICDNHSKSSCDYSFIFTPFAPHQMKLSCTGSVDLAIHLVQLFTYPSMQMLMDQMRHVEEIYKCTVHVIAVMHADGDVSTTCCKRPNSRPMGKNEDINLTIVEPEISKLLGSSSEKYWS